MTGLPLIRIIDDDAELRNSQKMLLERLGWEVATYSSAIEFLENDAMSRPGCMILDVRMPEMTGLELQRKLKEQKSTIPIIFLSAHGDISMAVQTMQNGAVDFLEKPVEPQQLLARVNAAIASSLRQSVTDEETARIIERVEKLSPRERKVAELVTRGLRNKVIARELGIEETTVKMHRANAALKLGVGTTAELARLMTIAEIKGGEQQ